MTTRVLIVNLGPERIVVERTGKTTDGEVSHLVGNLTMGGTYTEAYLYGGADLKIREVLQTANS